jgi:hypothetical protein
LQATGKASVRRRNLPAEHVVWLVIAFLAVQAALNCLNNCSSGSWPRRWRACTLALGAHAGVSPSDKLSWRTTCQMGSLRNRARPIAQAVCGLRLLAVDGVVWCAPDTPDNRQAQGCCANQHGQGS